MNKFALAIAGTLLSTSAIAAENCVLKQVTNTEQHGTIESVKDITRFVTAWTNDQRKCNVEFNALVDNQWHEGFGAYAFGNDESENKACAVALNTGKKMLLEELFPQDLQSEDVLICGDQEKKERRTGLEGLTPNSTKPTFYLKGAMCGWYFQTVQEQNGLYQWNIIACELQPNKWTVVDKF